MRFVSTDAHRVTATQLRNALVAAGAGYDVLIDDTVATIIHDAATIAHVELNVPGDGLFEQEREELTESVTGAEGDGSNKARVLEALRNAQTIVAAQILYGTGNTDATLASLDPLWTWLFQNRRGLLQADSEGYYDAEGLVLEVE
jgi:hypothetical protein